MSNRPKFENASAYQGDVLALPVSDIEAASRWYGEKFGMKEVDRQIDPVPTVILERDGVRLGFSANGGDPTQDGASIRVDDIRGVRQELEANVVKTSNWRIDERDGRKFQVFFVVAPDGLCYYFNQPLSD